MSRNLVSMRTAQIVNVAIAAARPTLATDGVDITNWRVTGSFGNPLAAVLVSGTIAATVSSPTGGAKGVELWGYVQGAWWLIGYLNNGDDVPVVAAGQGFAQELDVIGIFDRLAIAGTASAGAANAALAPMESYT